MMTMTTMATMTIMTTIMLTMTMTKTMSKTMAAAAVAAAVTATTARMASGDGSGPGNCEYVELTRLKNYNFIFKPETKRQTIDDLQYFSHYCPNNLLSTMDDEFRPHDISVSYGLYSYGLYRHGLYSHGLWYI